MRKLWLIGFGLSIFTIGLILACSKTPTSPPQSPPETPTGVIVTNTSSSTSLIITWNGVSGATSYKAYRATSVNGPFTTAVYNDTNNGFEDTGLSQGTTYYYEIAAIGSGGTSAASAAVAGTTTSAAPGTFSIAGTITLNGAGLAGVTVSTGPVTATTASDGTYTLPGLSNGTYTITPNRSGYTFNPASLSVTISGSNVSGKNFTATAVPNTYSITGTITSNGSGLSGVTVGTGSVGATTTVNGTYTLSGLSNGTYIITPSRSGYTFNPTSLSVTISGSNVIGKNFTATAVPNTYVLTVQTDGYGSASPATVSVTAGAQTTITINPNTGYHFDHWSTVNGTPPTFVRILPTSTIVTLNNADATIKAYFTPDQYTLTVQSDGNGDVNPSGSRTVNYSTSTSISASPHSGYKFDHWQTVNGSPSISNQYAISTSVVLTSGSATVKAVFALLPSITVTSPNGGESWYQGQRGGITWTSNSAVSSTVNISLYENGVFSQTLLSNVANNGACAWNVPVDFPVNSNCQIRVSDANNSSVYDMSNSYFSIIGVVMLTTANEGYATTTGWAFSTSSMLVGYHHSPWPLNSYTSRAFAWFSIPSQVSSHTVVSATLTTDATTTWNSLLAYIQLMSIPSLSWSSFYAVPQTQKYGLLVGNQESYLSQASALFFNISPSLFNGRSEMGFALLAVPETASDTNEVTLYGATLVIYYRQ